MKSSPFSMVTFLSTIAAGLLLFVNGSHALPHQRDGNSTVLVNNMPRKCHGHIGDCERNNCNGLPGFVCTTGDFEGCPCGMHCGKIRGPCWGEGCHGANGRCIAGYYAGCQCY